MNRPYVIVNCAMSADGKSALPSRKQMRISCEEDIKRMYRLRNECDAVLVGVETILADDPKLTVKEHYVDNPQQPLRVVLDCQGRTPADSLVMNDKAQTLIVTAKGKEKSYDASHVEVIGCETDEQGFIDISKLLVLLFKRGVKKLLVEGGGTVIWSFLKNRVVDDFFVYIGPCVIGGKDTPTVADGEGIRSEKEVISLKIAGVTRLGPGLLLQYKLVE